MRFTSSPKPDPATTTTAPAVELPDAVAEAERSLASISAARADAQVEVNAAREARQAITPAAYPVVGLDRAAISSANERHARDIEAADRRLSGAVRSVNFLLEQETAAASLLEAARTARDLADAADIRTALGITASALVASVPHHGAHAAPGLALLEEQLAALAKVNASLRAAGIEPEPVAPSSLVGSLPALIDPRPGVVGALATLLALAIWLDEAPQRAASRAANDRAATVEAARYREACALRGDLGIEERTAAQERQRLELAAWYRRPPALLAASALALPSAPSEDE